MNSQTIWSYFTRTSGARLELFARLVLGFFAVDVVANMLAHGGRYGVGGFNVAHFTWLDTLLPNVSPGFYVATMSLAAGSAGLAALLGPRRELVVVAAVTMNLGWAMSLLDSYQHHYLLGLLLVCMIGFSKKSSDASQDGEEPRSAPWGYGLTCLTVSNVYVFAAISKAEPAWRSGVALKQIVGERAHELIALWTELGLSVEAFWLTAGHSTYLVQFFLAGVYLIAPLSTRSRLLTLVRSVGLIVALSFHIGAEYLELQIEWFSYYMLLIAVFFLGPTSHLDWLAETLTRVWQRILESRVGTFLTQLPAGFVGVMSALVVVVLSQLIDLPGVGFTGFVGAAGIVGLSLMSTSGSVSNRSSIATSLATIVVAGAMLLSADVFETRFDYYRYVGGDARRRAVLHDDVETRRQMLEHALDAYRKANHYAPADRDRRDAQSRVETLLSEMPSR